MNNKYKVLTDTVIQGRPLLKDEFIHLTEEEAAPYKGAGLIRRGSQSEAEVAVSKKKATQSEEADTETANKKAAK